MRLLKVGVAAPHGKAGATTEADSFAALRNDNQKNWQEEQEQNNNQKNKR
jgi:hypothetical protein